MGGLSDGIMASGLNIPAKTEVVAGRELQRGIEQDLQLLSPEILPDLDELLRNQATGD